MSSHVSHLPSPPASFLVLHPEGVVDPSAFSIDSVTIASYMLAVVTFALEGLASKISTLTDILAIRGREMRRRLRTDKIEIRRFSFR